MLRQPGICLRDPAVRSLKFDKWKRDRRCPVSFRLTIGKSAPSAGPAIRFPFFDADRDPRQYRRPEGRFGPPCCPEAGRRCSMPSWAFPPPGGRGLLQAGREDTRRNRPAPPPSFGAEPEEAQPRWFAERDVSKGNAGSCKPSFPSCLPCWFGKLLHPIHFTGKRVRPAIPPG